MIRTIVIFLSLSQSLLGLSPANTTKTKEKPKTILFLGDSLTAGYGVGDSSSYVALLEESYKKQKNSWRFVNGAVSGSTTASCSGRLKWQLKSKLDAIFIALGANDGLRGVPVKTSKENLEKCIALAQKNKVKVFLAGMLLPRNYGEKYRKEFSGMYLDLQKKFKFEFMPFLLEGVGGELSLNQADGIHPNEKGHKVIYENVKKFLGNKL